MRSFTSLVSLIAFGFLVTGCGNGMGSGSGSGISSSAIAAAAVNQVNVQAIKASATTAHASLQKAKVALSTIFSPSGSFNWSIFLGGVDFSSLGASTQTCLANAFPTDNALALVLTAPTDIATALKCVLDDVAQVAGIANTDLTGALSILNASLAQVPVGSADALMIQSMINEITPLLTSYNAMMATLGAQMGLVTSFLNTLPTLAAGAVPIPLVGILVGMSVSSFVQPVEMEIMHFQSQIEAL
jgi:hypothetical protein